MLLEYILHQKQGEYECNGDKGQKHPVEGPPVEIVDDDPGNGRGGSGRNVRHRTEQSHGESSPVIGKYYQQYRLDQWQDDRSEEHTSELQSRFDLVCR